MSPDIQEKYRIAEESDTEDWLDVTDQLQRDILKENLVGDADIEGALVALRTATYVYPQLATIPVYRKYQRAREGDLQEGCQAPQVSSLLSINGEKAQSSKYPITMSHCSFFFFPKLFHLVFLISFIFIFK